MTLLTALPAAAQQDKAVLRVIPPDALGFLVINRVDETSNKILSLAKKMQLPLPIAPLELLKVTVGISEGLNTKGSAAVALFAAANEDDPPIPVVFLPVSDYKQMIGKLKTRDGGDGLREFTALDKLIQVGNKESYAVFADLKDRDLLRKVVAGKAHVLEWSTPLHAWLGQQDIAGIVTAHGWKTLTDRAIREVERGKAELANGPPELAKAMEGLMEGVLGLVKSAQTDVTHMALGARLDDKLNLHVNTQARFAKDSGFAKAADTVKNLPGGPLAGLPGGPFALAAGGVVPPKAMGELSKMSVEMVKAVARDLPADKVRKLEQFYEASYQGVHGMGVLVGAGKPADALFSQMVASVHVKSATAYLDFYEKGLRELTEILGDLGAAGAGVMPKMVPKKSKIEGFQVLELTVAIPGQGESPIKGVMEKMFGEGGMAMTYAAVGPQTIIMSYARAAKMKNLLAAYQQKKDRLTHDPQVVQAMAMLPEGSQWALLVNPKGLTDMVNTWLEVLDPNTRSIPAFPRPGIAIAGARLSTSGLELHAVVPIQVLEPIMDYVNKIRDRIEN
jgi:hypothetical protein